MILCVCGGNDWVIEMYWRRDGSGLDRNVGGLLLMILVGDRHVDKDDRYIPDIL